jgi:choloylglycine hydrolase
MLYHHIARALCIATLAAPIIADACSVAFWNNNDKAKVVARSMDLYMSDMPLLQVNPAGIQRKSTVGTIPLTWTSRYGSVVVTAFHTDSASDGMNEHGLNAHLLYLDGSKYPDENPKMPTLSNAQWAQYILDNFKTVKEALASMELYQIQASEVHGKKWPIHIAIEDPSGDSAIIEFIDGKALVHHGKEFNTMTNEPAYNIQLENLKKYKLFGGTLAMPGDVDPLSRFVRIASYLKTLPKPANYIDAIAGALSVMRTAMVPFGAEDTSGNETTDAWPTRWITLSDLTQKIFYFSSTTAPNIVWIDFKNVNLTKKGKTLMVDPTNIELVGEISAKLKPQ